MKPYYLLSVGSPVTCMSVTLSDSKCFLKFGDDSGIIREYDLKIMRQIHSYEKHSHVLQVSEKGSQGKEGIIMWNEKCFQCMQSTFCKYSENENDCAFTSSDCEISIVSDGTLKSLSIEKYGFGMIMCLKLKMDVLFVGFECGNVLVIDRQQLTVIQSIDIFKSSILDLDIFSDYLVCSTTNNTLALLRFKDSQWQIVKKSKVGKKGNGVVKFLYLNDSVKILSANWNNQVVVSDLSLETIAEINHHTGPVNCIEYARIPNEQIIHRNSGSKENVLDMIFLGSKDGTISVWDFTPSQ